MDATFTSKLTGQPKRVRYGDPVFDTLDNCRVRFVRMVDSTSVEIASIESVVFWIK